ncbi:MAG: NUDIX hydrolase [Rhodospirillales bacterium]|nr:NUDIX hydrolase [Rhodospirillales bacterium]
MLTAPVPGLPGRSSPVALTPQRPIVGVGVVVLRDDRVLLVRRANPPRQGEWSLPGGRQRLGETVFAAAEREVLEETGTTIGVQGVVDVVDYIDRVTPDGPIRFHYTLVDVIADWLGGDPVPGDDATEAAWVAVDDLAGLDLWAETLRVIHLAGDRRDLGRARRSERSAKP